MSWIKRNLYFLIGSAVALALIGLAAWYLYAKWQLNGQNLEKLNADYATLSELNNKKPHPGNDKIDNHAAATSQTAQLLAFKEKARSHFQRIPPIPDLPAAELTDQSFATNFSRTVSQLQREATNASIQLPADYYFSFQAQARKLSFAAKSLEPLSIQLGEVKAICDVLYQAKINAIDAIRRERISPDDQTSSGTGDYLPDKSVTNAQAVITPYELSFRCFSQELGAVIAGFACSPYSLVVKAVNVEGLSAAALADLSATSLVATPAAPATPAFVPSAVPNPINPMDPARQAAQRYNRYGPGRLRGMPGYRPTPATQPPPSTFGVPAAPETAGSTNRSALALDERQLKVVMVVSIVKLESKPAAAAVPKREPRPAAASIVKP